MATSSIARKSLLSDESRKVLVGYHRLQMKREQLSNPAETAIVPLLDLLDEIRLKWKHAEERILVAEERVERLEQTKSTLMQELKESRDKNHEAIGQISSLKAEKRDLEAAVKEYERRLNTLRSMIHENLKDTVEFDKVMGPERRSRVTTRTSRRVEETVMESTEAAADSGDEVKLRYNRAYRRSRSANTDQHQSRDPTKPKRSRISKFDYIDEEPENSENVPPVKRSRGGRPGIDPITTITTITMDASGQTPTRASVEVHRTKKRSVSASRVLDESSAHRRLVARSPRMVTAASNSDLRHKTPTGIGSSWTRGRPIEECVHKFAACRKVIGHCTVCNRQISFMGKTLQCDYCNMCVHESCKSRAPVPCLPTVSFPATPKRTAGGNMKISLADSCPINPPYIPALLIRCICAIEKDHLKVEGLYRIPGSKVEIDRLYRDFQKGIPNLALEPTEVITGCVKMFLRTLKDPLIPRSSYGEFMKAADDDDKLIEAIGELPEPNRDTLAYLCLHLQKVAAFSAENKMVVDNLARILCPTILRTDNGRYDTLDYLGAAQNEMSELERQQFVLKRLITMPADFWSDYLNARTVSKAFTSATPATHQVHTAGDKSKLAFSGGSSSGRADCSVLGPVSSTPPQNFTPGFGSARRIKEPLF